MSAEKEDRWNKVVEAKINVMKATENKKRQQMSEFQ